MLDNEYLFTITDLKQYSYCPRVVFYEQCLPHVRPRTYKMEAGEALHEDEPKRAVRRSVQAYALDAGRREFEVAITSPTLGLTGIIDEVVYGDDGQVFPVDYKLAKKVGKNHRIQLTAYGLLLSEALQQPIDFGYVYLIAKRQMVKVAFTDTLRQEVQMALQAVYTIATQELMPPPAQNRIQCVDCEFRRFCNDISQ